MEAKNWHRVLNAASRVEEEEEADWVVLQQSGAAEAGYSLVKPASSDLADQQWELIEIDQEEETQGQQLRYLVRRGVPDGARRYLWTSLISSCQIDPENFYAQRSACFGEVMPSSYRSVPTFGAQAGTAAVDCPESFTLTQEGIHVASQLLCVLAFHHPLQEYCPVIGDIIMLTLHFCSDAEAYEIGRILLDGKERHLLEGTVGLACLSPRISAHITLMFSALIRSTLPKIYKHLTKLGVMPQDFSHWFQTFFRELPLKTRFRVFDLYANEGMSAVFRVALALLQWNEAVFSWIDSGEAFLGHMGQFMADLHDSGLLIRRAFKLKKPKLRRIVKRTGALLEGASFSSPSSNHVFFRPNLVDPSRICPEISQWDSLYSYLPSRLTIGDPNRVFCSVDDGASWTLVEPLLEQPEASFILLLRTVDGQTLGCTLVQPRNECCVFSLGSEVSRCFHWAGSDRCHLVVHPVKGLLLGVDPLGNAALSIDASLQRGSSQKSTVFENDQLASMQHFDIQVLELFSII